MMLLSMDWFTSDVYVLYVSLTEPPCGSCEVAPFSAPNIAERNLPILTIGRLHIQTLWSDGHCDGLIEHFDVFHAL